MLIPMFFYLFSYFIMSPLSYRGKQRHDHEIVICIPPSLNGCKCNHTYEMCCVIIIHINETSCFNYLISTALLACCTSNYSNAKDHPCLVQLSLFCQFGGHPQGRSAIKSEKEMGNIGKQPFCFNRVIPLLLFQEDNKRRQTKLRVKSKVNWSQENVNQFYRSPTRDMQPLVKKMLEYLHSILAPYP